MNKRSRRRCRKNKYSVGVGLPKPYDGGEDRNDFDMWTFEVRNYVEIMDVDNRLMSKLVADTLTGKAKRFYIDYVALEEQKRTVDRIIPALVDYCFLDNVIRKLRKK